LRELLQRLRRGRHCCIDFHAFSYEELIDF